MAFRLEERLGTVKELLALAMSIDDRMIEQALERKGHLYRLGGGNY